MPKISLHIDGLILFGLGLGLFIHFGYQWWIFPLFLFTPDIFMLGYLLNPRIGARVYNIGHSLLWPAALLLLSFITPGRFWLAAALIWTAHIGMDHALGYGYKYDDAFKHTHYSEV